MKSLKDYLLESETYLSEDPIVGDTVAINIREEYLVESHITKINEDEMWLEADEKMLEILNGYGLLESLEEDDVDDHAVRELVLYAENDGDLYQRSAAPIMKNLSKKWAKGVYDHEKAIKLWKYHADRSAKKYGMDFGNNDGFRIFTPRDRWEAAKEFADSWQAELDAGNFMDEGIEEDIVDVTNEPADIVSKDHDDHEGDMAQNQLHSIIRAARRLDGIIDDDDELPAWVQSKITKSADYIDTAADYLDSEEEQEVAEDWGSSDSYVLVKAIEDAIKRNGLSPEVIRDEAESLADMYCDDMGYDDHDECVEVIIDTWRRGSDTGRKLSQMFAPANEEIKEGADPKLASMIAKFVDDVEAELRYFGQPDAAKVGMLIKQGNVEDAAGEMADAMTDQDGGSDKFDTVMQTAQEYIEAYMSENESYEFGSELDEAEYQGRKVKLGKPTRGDVKKFKVYVKDPKTGNVKKVNFGHGGTSAKKAGQKTMKIKKSNPARRKSFRARHNCDNPGPRTKARYWSCRAW